ncbi:MAG TPA: universal stress protein [Streptosporangiaceae bacterium]|nr:universal stress protein [Streptosporangiaceae bacterium]
MYERLLVAVDHSHVSEHVLKAATELALLASAEVWVLHLREREAMAKAPGAPALVAAETTDKAEAEVEAAVDKLARAGVKAHGEVRNTIFGHAAREIIADAEAHDVGLIIMGSKGRGDLAGLVLGSTTHKVIHLTERPVLVVR